MRNATAQRNLWRAGCSETGTAGSESGLGKRSGESHHRALARLYLWPIGTAVIPADTTIIFDTIGLPLSGHRFWPLLELHRAARDDNPHDEPDSAALLRTLVTAKTRARKPNPAPATATSTQQKPQHPLVSAPKGASTKVGHPPIAALQQWADLCDLLAGTGWQQDSYQVTILRRTSKTTVACVRTGDHQVIVKLLTGADPYQAGLFANEINVYAAFAANRPPVSAPKMLLSTPYATVVSHVDGFPLSIERYPRQPIPTSQIHAALVALQRFHAWRAPTLPRNNQPAKLQHAKAAAQLDAWDARAYNKLRRQAGGWQLAHGDAVPSNLLLKHAGRCALIDFEHTGAFLPGYDYAVLRTVLADQPDTVTDLIDEFAIAHAGSAGYTANLVTAAAREVRMLDFFVPDPSGYRPYVVMKAWAHARHELHHHLAVQTHFTQGQQ